MVWMCGKSNPLKPSTASDPLLLDYFDPMNAGKNGQLYKKAALQ